MLPIRDRNPTRRTPVVTVALILLNIGIYFLVQPQGDEVESTTFSYEYAAVPEEVSDGRPLTCGELAAGFDAAPSQVCQAPDEPVFPDKRVWLAVIYSLFFHGSLLHLGGNMLFLWVFGNNIEDHLGAVRYLAFYLASGVVATLAHVALQPDSVTPLIGASGAVAGVMGAYLVWFPNVRILTAFFLVIIREITAKWWLGIWFASQFLINREAGVAADAHVGGFVFGVLVGLVVRAFRPVRAVTWRNQYTSPPEDRYPF
jgi:membrane associated rhomboid family serine protease